MTIIMFLKNYLIIIKFLSYNDFYTNSKASTGNESYSETLDTYKKIIEKKGNESTVENLVKA